MKKMIYQCDACKKEMESKDQLITVMLNPTTYKTVMGNVISAYGSETFDICEECKENFLKMVRNRDNND